MTIRTLDQRMASMNRVPIGRVKHRQRSMLNRLSKSSLATAPVRKRQMMPRLKNQVERKLLAMILIRPEPLISKIQRTQMALRGRISHPKTLQKRILTTRLLIQRSLMQNLKTSPANNRAPTSPGTNRIRVSLLTNPATNPATNRVTNPAPISHRCRMKTRST